MTEEAQICRSDFVRTKQLRGISVGTVLDGAKEKVWGVSAKLWACCTTVFRVSARIHERV